MAANSTGDRHDGVDSSSHLPAIAAAFLVTFDNRKGYTLTWSRSLSNIQLEGVVEFKSLPSGLHNIEEDLVYFVYQDYAGISAFKRVESDAESRNARMLSVGVLVSRESGRMGKSWLYAQDLKDLAEKLVHKPDDLSTLEKYWEEHKDSEETATGSPAADAFPNGYQNLRASSTTSLAIPNYSLTPHHPALALSDLLQVFGPLLFPLFRAAILQQRILILGEAPVELCCNFVYNISVLASLSRSLAAVVPIEDPTKLRLETLFNVGVADIDLLSSLQTPWVACTTDDVLCSKPKLFDLLVIMPATSALHKGGNKKYPMLIPSNPELSRSYPHEGVRATQRDARRYQALKTGLRAFSESQRVMNARRPTLIDREDDSASTTSTVSTIPDMQEAVEPISWPLIAYNSLIWWASAGDRRSGLMDAEEQETEQDTALLFEDQDSTETTKEVAMVAYFHRLSKMIFQGLGRIVQRDTAQEHYQDDFEHDNEDREENDEDRVPLTQNIEGDEAPIEIGEEDMRAIGLDVWSESDRKFIAEMLRVWWGRTASITGGTVECCGLRLL